VRTHLPDYHPPPGYLHPVTGRLHSISSPPLELQRVQHSRYHAQLDEHGNPTGLGLLACLVLRNVARTVQLALDVGGDGGGAGGPAGGGASIAALAGGESSIFEELEAAGEGGGSRDGVLGVLEKVDLKGARRGREALVGLEGVLVGTVLEDFGLGKVLGEVVGVVMQCK